MVNSFRWAQYCAAIIQHLLYGMEKMHCHRAAVKEPLKDSQGFSPMPRLWPWHRLVGGGQTTCILLWHGGCEDDGQKIKFRCTRVKWRRDFIVCAKFENRSLCCKKWVNIPHNFSGAKKSPMRLCIRSQCSSVVGQNAAVSTGAWPGGNETLCRQRRRDRRCPLFLNSPLNI